MMKVNKKELKDFISTWQTQGSEVADKVTYWNTLLELLGVPKEQIDNKTYIEYEKPIKLHANEPFHGSIDAYIPSTRVLIEQKSNGVDLFKPENRPNGNHTEKITPFSQAKRYDDHLGSKEKANFLVLSNFSQIVVYDVRESIDTKPVIINIEDLEKDLYLLNFLVKPDDSKRLEKEKRVSFAAGTLVSQIYNELADIFAKYDQTDDEKIKHSINTLCVRLVFCLYAEDAGLFPTKEQFYNYLEPIQPNKMGLALKALFKTLDTEDRKAEDPFWEDENPELAQFPYVNGGLFADENIIIPPFTEKLKDIILNKASRGFDWSDISPTIFGAVFESTLNPETRRSGGMHYTSIENIHKVIDPLFLDDLKAKLEKIKQYKNQKTIHDKAVAFQEELANLTFFDPACGSGNFLTETFLSLRRLENEAIRLELGGESVLDVVQAKDWIKVSIQQFSGIEINDFAVSVAKTALWIAEDQMMQETQDLLYARDWNFLPLKTYTRIHKGNAIQIDWNKVIPNYACDFIIGNPPFIGALKVNKEQKADRKQLTQGIKHGGILDYVALWYIKAADYIQNTKCKVAFVSTNSIVQGTQVPVLWSYLFSKGIKINFAYRSFVWNNEAKNKAQVVCVIIGFSLQATRTKIIFDHDQPHIAKNINPYLIDAPTVFIESRTKPICKVPLFIGGLNYGDGHHYLLTKEEADEIIEKEPQAEKYIHIYLSDKDLLHGKKQYCLWLANAKPNELASMPMVLKHVAATKAYRESFKGRNMRNYASKPLIPIFSQYYSKSRIHNALAVPLVSADRTYIPMTIVDKDIICSNMVYLLENPSNWLFGILESKVMMAWIHMVGSRLGTGYRFINTIVYNNFPWPELTDQQKEKINKTAQTILDVRAKYPDSSLAVLYGEFTMPVDLQKAHEANDRAVLKAYGLPTNATEEEIVAHLFKMYEELTK